MKIMEKNCISTLLVFFFFFLQVSHLEQKQASVLWSFFMCVHIHSVKNDIFHFCESAKN